MNRRANLEAQADSSRRAVARDTATAERIACCHDEITELAQQTAESLSNALMELEASAAEDENEKAEEMAATVAAELEALTRSFKVLATDLQAEEVAVSREEAKVQAKWQEVRLETARRAAGVQQKNLLVMLESQHAKQSEALLAGSTDGTALLEARARQAELEEEAGKLRSTLEECAALTQHPCTTSQLSHSSRTHCANCTCACP